mgnify:CR=1 FL=1
MYTDFPGLDQSTLPFSFESLARLIKMVLEAGKTAVEMRAQVDISTKTGPEDLVTSADKKLSEILMGGLQKEFPHDHVLSEVHPWEEMSTSERRWFIDPIDGTKHYVAETGLWSVMAGLVDGNEPIFGIFYIPAKKLLYFGGPACGSWCWNVDGVATKLNLAPIANARSVSAMLSKNDVNKNLWCQQISGISIQTASSIGLDVHEVLQSNVDAFVHIRPTLKTWDTAAPAAVALGAGLEIGTEDTYGFTYPYDNPAHNYCTVIGRKGTVSWWQKGFMNCNPQVAMTQSTTLSTPQLAVVR